MLRVELENEKRIALELYGERESIIHKVTDVLQSMIADLKHVFPTWNFYVEPKLASVDSPQPYKNKYEHKNHYKIQSVVSVSLTARCSTYQAFQQYSNSETLMLCTVYFNRYGRLFVVSSHGDRHNCYVSDVFESHELIRWCCRLWQRVFRYWPILMLKFRQLKTNKSRK